MIFGPIINVQRYKPQPEVPGTFWNVPGTFLVGKIMSPELLLDPGSCGGQTLSSCKGSWFWCKVPAVEIRLNLVKFVLLSSGKSKVGIISVVSATCVKA